MSLKSNFRVEVSIHLRGDKLAHHSTIVDVCPCAEITATNVANVCTYAVMGDTELDQAVSMKYITYVILRTCTCNSNLLTNCIYDHWIHQNVHLDVVKIVNIDNTCKLMNLTD
jgi:hypothetical protein